MLQQVICSTSCHQLIFFSNFKGKNNYLILKQINLKFFIYFLLVLVSTPKKVLDIKKY